MAVKPTLCDWRAAFSCFSSSVIRLHKASSSCHSWESMLSCLQLRRDRVKDGAEAGADGRERGNRGDRYQRGDQAILDRGGTCLVLVKLQRGAEHSSGSPISGGTGPCRGPKIGAKNYQRLNAGRFRGCLRVVSGSLVSRALI